MELLIILKEKKKKKKMEGGGWWGRGAGRRSGFSIKAKTAALPPQLSRLPSPLLALCVVVCVFVRRGAVAFSQVCRRGN